MLLVLACLLAGAFQAAPASAACPNEVFRSIGASAKLPDCRSYELVSPAYSGGAKPSATNFSNVPSAFDFPTITDSADSVVFNTVGAALSGSDGSGFADRYRARRTAEGWETEFIGPTAEQTGRPAPGGISSDHQYYFVNAGFGDFYLEPESSLQAPFGGHAADYLRKPNGEFELIARGSLKSARLAVGRFISPGGTHVIFSTPEKIEEAAGTAGEQIYDRPAGSATSHVVSLRPGDVTPTGSIAFVGYTEDGKDVVFSEDRGSYAYPSDNLRWYVRVNNAVTKEVVRSNGLQVGKSLTCNGSGGTARSYEWLRNGSPIPGAASATYTVSVADAGSVLQCQVRASTSEGESIRTSLPPLVVWPYEGKDVPFHEGGWGPETASVPTPHNGYAEVGDSLTCAPTGWKENPTFSYQWFRNGTEIGGATNASYSPVGADEGAGLQCRITATNSDGTVVGFSNPVSVHPSPAFTTASPKLENVTDPGEAPEAGDELSCTEGTWTDSGTVEYQWLRNGTAIPGATADTYTVAAPEDEGATLQCVVDTTTAVGTTRAISNEVVADPQPGSPAPSHGEGYYAPGVMWGPGSPVVGDTLSCYSSEWEWTGEPSFSYAWLRNGQKIVGATGGDYVLTAEDLGTVVQCLVIATNASGTAVSVASSESGGFGPRYVSTGAPVPAAELPAPGMAYAGVFGGQVFFGDRAGGGYWGDQKDPSALFSYNIADGTVTRITDVEDARFSYVSEDGSRVYFVSESEIGGEGSDGEPNLYVWSRGDDSTKFITTVEPKDLEIKMVSQGGQQGANLASWTFAMNPNKESIFGKASAYTRGTPDGSVFLFETTAQLTSFNNTEEMPGACGEKATSGDRCQEAYLYDTSTEELTCVSCPEGGTGPATGHVAFYEWWPIMDLNRPNNLSNDGNTVVFESTEDLLPQDGNEQRDVYRWKKGVGLSLISTGQEITPSFIYGITSNASDIAFVTTQQLLPWDENGGIQRIYDARVNGGFPPPESVVTEPCAGDACQGNPTAAPSAPSIASESLDGGGNVVEKIHCRKGTRRVVRHGKELCVKRRHHRAKHHHHRHRRARADRGAVR